MKSSLTIGGASGFWGEAGHATAQLLTAPDLDALIYDYLAEITLSIMARARMKDPAMGYAPDFVTEAMAPNLSEIAERGVKVLSNAGGLNPAACAEALRAEIARQGLSLKVGVVEGDDLSARAAEFRDRPEMFSGAQAPEGAMIASLNAYLGAFPIAAALDAGADIVVTGRCVDSALALGACVHRFGWTASDYDLLSAGSLAGHLIECGPQATGGNFTDWREAGDIARIGYPVARVEADGVLEISKPAGTTGVVSRLSVAEQMLYEIGDPRAYLLPDVACDFSEVALETIGPDRVRASGARGRPPSGMLKASMTYVDGFRGGHVLQFSGVDARAKATAYVEAGLARARAKLKAMGAPDYRDVAIETFGGRPDGGNVASGFEEISVKAAARHDDARAVGLFLKEIVGAALATPPGLHFFTGAGRPKPSPVVALHSIEVAEGEVDVSVTVDGAPVAYAPPSRDAAADASGPAPTPPAPKGGGPLGLVRLETLAVARSGDKGDAANIGVIARDPRALPWIWRGLTDEAIRAALPDAKGAIERYWLPGSHSMNLLCREALGGGGVASLSNDAQGKAYAQRLLSVEIEAPAALEKDIGEAA